MGEGARSHAAPDPQAVLDWMLEREGEMLALLARLVEIPSHTPDKAGNDAVGAVLAETMRGLGFAVETVPQTEVGDHLVARNSAASALPEGGRQVLFCGHMDTVFPASSGFTAFADEGERVVGPGVIDMKGGLVAGIYALAALHAHGLLDDMPVAFVFNSDEETGSYHSRDLIMAEAKKSAFAFVFECAGLAGETTTGRKGKTTFKVAVRGRAGHAGNLAADKPSAVLALAHLTIALEALNDPARGVSVNVGLVSGGVGPNTVAPLAEAVVECRFVGAADGAELERAVASLAAAPAVPGTSIEVQTVPGRPPMEQSAANRALLAAVAEAGRELGADVTEDFRGGVSDANYIAHAGTPVLDGLGPAGEHDHSPREYMVKASLPRRAALASVAARRLWDALSGGGA